MGTKKNTVLRSIVTSDETFIRKCLKESDTNFLSQKFIDKLSNCKEWIYGVLRSTTEEVFIIYHREEKELVPIGVLSMHSIDFDFETAEMSMVIMRKYCSAGHGRRSAKQLSAYALQIMQLQEMTIVIHPDNTAALRGMEKRD